MVDPEKLQKILEESRRELLKRCMEKKESEKLKKEQNANAPEDKSISENYKPEDSLVHRFLDHDANFPGHQESNYTLHVGCNTKDDVLNYIRNRSMKR